VLLESLEPDAVLDAIERPPWHLVFGNAANGGGSSAMPAGAPLQKEFLHPGTPKA